LEQKWKVRQLSPEVFCNAAAELLINIYCHKLVRDFSRREMIEVPCDIEVIGSYFAVA
jgi:hypothetical protein